MNKEYIIKERSVHLWQVFVPELVGQVSDFLLLLNPVELKRAERFRFAVHRERFIVARAMLRRILSLYINCLPQAIQFVNGERGKPFLQTNPQHIQFNVSHSEDMAVYAITHQFEIGVDIEKIKDAFDDAVAKRFFSAEEYAALSKLNPTEKIKQCYRVWAGKEALVKALGEGLYAPLGDFSVDFSREIQMVSLMHQQKLYPYHLENFVVNDEYQAAFATPQVIDEVVCWRWSIDGIQKF